MYQNVNPKYIMIIVSAIVGIGLLVLGGNLTWNAINLYLHGISATGFYERTIHQNRGQTYEYTFQDAAGQTHAAQSTSYSPQIKIIYNPTSPDQNIVDTGFDWLLGLGILVLSIMLLAASFLGYKGVASSTKQ